MGLSEPTVWARAADRNALLRVERVLGEIRVRVRVRLGGDGEVAAHAREDLRRLARAVEGVMGLHARDAAGTCRTCCSRRWWQARRRRRGWRWPCPTLRTLTAAIDTGEHR